MADQKRRGRPKKKVVMAVNNVLDKTELDEQLLEKVDELKSKLQELKEKVEAEKAEFIEEYPTIWERIYNYGGHLALVPFVWFACQDNFVPAILFLAGWVAWFDTRKF